MNRDRRAGDGGFGLPELIVTVVLLGMMMSLVVGVVVSISRTFTRDRAASDSTMVAAVGMNELTRVLRAGTELAVAGGGATNAPVFVSAEANAVTFYSFIDTDAAAATPVKVRFSIDAQRRLIETRWAATTTDDPWAFVADGSPTSSRTIARSIPAGSPALFTYLDVNSAPIAIPATGFTEDQRRLIAAVRITLRVQADTTGRAEPVTLQNAIGIPNLGISRVRP